MTNDNARQAAKEALEGRVVLRIVGWYVPYFLQNMPNQTFSLDYLISNSLSETRYIKKSAFELVLTTWKLGLGVENGNKVPIYVLIGFQQRFLLGDQKGNIDVFYRHWIACAQSCIATKNIQMLA